MSVRNAAFYSAFNLVPRQERHSLPLTGIADALVREISGDVIRLFSPSPERTKRRKLLLNGAAAYRSPSLARFCGPAIDIALEVIATDGSKLLSAAQNTDDVTHVNRRNS